VLAVTISDVLVAAPVAVVFGLLIGFWLGARFDLRKKRDV
jgi:hypothetical protein